MLNRRFAIWILTVFALGALSLPLGAQGLKPEYLRAPSLRFAGPMQGNRASAVVGIPGNSNVYYIRSGVGGIWKSADGGFRWQPVFDQEPAQSIGALAVDPAQPSVIWAGTGESWVIRNGITPGDGIYKSADAGKTWMNMGLSDAGLISRVILNLYNSNNVFVCAMGVGTHPLAGADLLRSAAKGRGE